MTTTLEQAPQIFQKDYYERLYDIEEKHWWAQGMREAMDALLKPQIVHQRELRTLDIGCGTGLLMNYLKEHYSIDGEVVGLDYSQHALDFCKMRGASKLIKGSATELPLPSQSFDLIICIDTIQHLAGAGADVQAIEEFYRVLHRGGLVYLRTNSRLGHLELKGADENQYRRYDIPTVTQLLEAAGFKVERATYLNMLPSAVAAMREFFTAAKHNHSHQHTEAIGPGLKIKSYEAKMQWLNNIMLSELRAEAAMLQAGMTLPFGHSCGFVARK